MLQLSENKRVALWKRSVKPLPLEVGRGVKTYYIIFRLGHLIGGSVNIPYSI